LAKRAAQQTGSTKLIQPATCHVIPLKHILPMAKTITSSRKPTIVIPEAIFRILDRAINLRRRVSDAYQQANKGCSLQDIESDSGHTHFVEVLEKVKELLKGKEIPPTTTCQQVTPVSTVAKEKEKDASITNGFSGLHIYETSRTKVDFGDMDMDMDLANPGKQDEHGEVYKVEQIPDSQEALIALQCLLEDLAAMRKVIQRLWEDYKDGSCDLVTASLTTNTAIELARRLEDDLKILDTYGGSTKLLRKMADLPVEQSVETSLDSNGDSATRICFLSRKNHSFGERLS
jgi:hypothetical protein